MSEKNAIHFGGTQPNGLVMDQELAAYINMSTRKIFQLRSEGIIPYVKSGKKILYRPSRVVEALEKKHGHNYKDN
jgi:hypothetical protein